jgi:nucleoside-diphosphate-sugar epimerase
VSDKIIITGANGFVGANLFNFLTENGLNVYGLVRNGAEISLVKSNKNLIYIDFDELEELENTLKNFDIIIHCAAKTKGKTFDEFYEANVLLTQRIVSIINKSKKCKQLLFISSQAATGPSNIKALKSETDKEFPVSNYGISKLLAEQKVKFCKKKWTIIRPCSVYGEGDKDFLVYFKLINKHIALTPGNRTKFISLIYIKDLIHAIEKCINNNEVHKKTLHLADCNIYTMNEFALLVSAVMDKQCFNLSVPDMLVSFTASVMELIYSNTTETPLLNKQKALEIAQDSWLLGSCETMRLLKIKQSTDIYQNLMNTYKWYQRNGML